jgi:hypothetical protein
MSDVTDGAALGMIRITRMRVVRRRDRAREQRDRQRRVERAV